LPGRVRSRAEIRTRARLTPVVIRAMRRAPLSLSLAWKTIPVMGDAAIEPTWPKVGSSPEAVPGCPAGGWESRASGCPPGRALPGP
jgi:hypothetical protein